MENLKIKCSKCFSENVKKDGILELMAVHVGKRKDHLYEELEKILI